GALLAEAEVARGSALTTTMDPEGVRILEASVPLAEASGDGYTLWRALNNAGSYYQEVGELRKAYDLHDRALELSERMGDMQQLGFLLSNVAETLIGLGEWKEARVRAERALAASQSVVDSWDRAYPWLQLGLISLREGNIEEAERILTSCVTDARAYDDLQALSWALPLLAEINLLRGDAEGAHRLLEPLMTTPEPYFRYHVGPVFAWALLERGDVEAAEKAATETIAEIRDKGVRQALSVALVVLGKIRIAQGERSKAAEAFAESVDLCRDMPMPFGQAWALSEWGLMDHNPSLLLEALDIFRRLGASKDVERIELALSNLSPSPAAG
ncbi:MAG: tetratricopeptide repeat protein, partial [Chloroflexota bacterium]